MAKGKTNVTENVNENEQTLVNPLRNEKIVVNFISKDRGLNSDPSSDFFGGMGTRSILELVVPTERNSSTLKNPLTKSEKNWFEEHLSQDLSVYHKPCYWSSSTLGAWNKVVLKKDGIVLDLSTPEGYIKYKILLLHPDLIAPSLQAMEDSPRATHRFYMTSEKEEAKAKNKKANLRYDAYMQYGKIKDKEYVLRYIIKVIDGQMASQRADLADLQNKVNGIIDDNVGTFMDIASDELLETKALLSLAAQKKLVNCNNNLYYLKDTNEKMALDGEEPRINAAAKYLNALENLDLLLMLQKKCGI